MRFPPAVIILLVTQELLFPAGGTLDVLCGELAFDTAAPPLGALLSNCAAPDDDAWWPGDGINRFI
uniref:Uncharacterized protein n=1 Tax=Glossina palpalis gambiensis TaxID=67801 RepID=A0A1B0B565_9MUSC